MFQTILGRRLLLAIHLCDNGSWYKFFDISRAYRPVAVILLSTLSPSISALTLDQVVSSQLGSHCRALKNGVSQSFVLPQFGPQLAGLCFDSGGAGPASAPSSAGGAAGSSQTSNPFIRRYRKIQENQNLKALGGGASADASASLTENLSVYFSSQIEGLDRKITTFEDGYHSNVWGASAGVDYQLNTWILAGVALNVNRWQGSFNGGGNFQTDSLGPTLYVSFFPVDGFFTDIAFRYAAKSFDKTRYATFNDFGVIKASGATNSNSGGDELETSALIGYDIPIKNFTIGPRVAVNYRRLNLNDYSETGNSGLELRYLRDAVTSLQTSIGFQASSAFSTGLCALIPQFTADWTHEYQLNQRFVNVQFAQDLRSMPVTFSYQTQTPDRNFFHVGTGIVAVFEKGIQSYANFEALLGHSYLNDYVGSVGIRVGF